MNLQLSRLTMSDRSTQGVLAINGVFECYTLEDVCRPDGKKVFGETAIPSGTYTIKITWSNRFQRMLPLVENVAGFEGIRIHPGNDDSNTDGCLLVGQARRDDWISNSKLAFDALFAKLQAAQERGEQIDIEVNNTDTVLAAIEERFGHA